MRGFAVYSSTNYILIILAENEITRGVGHSQYILVGCVVAHKKGGLRHGHGHNSKQDASRPKSSGEHQMTLILHFNAKVKCYEIN